MTPDIIDDFFQTDLSNFSDFDIRMEQSRDHDIRYWFSQVKSGVPPRKDSLPAKNIPFHLAMLIFLFQMVLFSGKVGMLISKNQFTMVFLQRYIVTKELSLKEA